ncbi:SDR family NAD(P)-dependent oxidoreductase [Prescottella defluvii]|uniref:SDR family NAD(P)-dependent oxidoreductase n=1 Tax=Prescottella defluvii TaxID=1323361 RepID=UPI0004F29726|nr:SDR family NAD(P)-dependent oxidoreductase [Prescottella defluvii]
MPTIAIVGAGPGLGLSIAKVFGGHGFDVALISRNKDKLDALVTELAETGITAEGFPADVADPDQLTGALQAAIARFGRIDVLEFSPHAGLTMTSPEDVTLDRLRPQIDALLYGAVAAVQTVLPEMLAAKSGTLLFTTGGGAINPYPMLADANIAQAGQRNWALNLHNTLAEQGIYVANVAINLMIGTQAEAPEGVPFRAPDEIALDYWNLHTDRTRAEHVVGA